MKSSSQEPNVLVLIAHPDLDTSRVNRIMTESISDLPHVTMHDLYRTYPDFKINVSQEQKLLLAADTIVFQFPLYWYSTPSLLKEWQDQVFQLGFAYGRGGDKLKGKKLLLVVSAGGPQEAYQPGGSNGYSLEELLRPIEQTVRACQMSYQTPLVIHHVHRKSEEELRIHAQVYRERLLTKRR